MDYFGKLCRRQPLAEPGAFGGIKTPSTERKCTVLHEQKETGKKKTLEDNRRNTDTNTFGACHYSIASG